MKKYFIPFSALMIVLGSCQPQNEPITAMGQNVDAIDMGLSVKWANMNVGATAPEESGLYFAWGETVGYTGPVSDNHVFKGENYKWMAEGQNSWPFMTKYTYPDNLQQGSWYQDGKFVGDNKTVLDPEDDAAHVNLGGTWRMPTDEEWEELRKECTWTWTTQNGVNGYLVTSPSPLKTSIFLPAAGYCYEDEVLHDGESGVYWSASLNQALSASALTNLFNENEVSKSQCARIYGPTVRAVCR